MGVDDKRSITREGDPIVFGIASLVWLRGWFENRFYR